MHSPGGAGRTVGRAQALASAGRVWRMADRIEQRFNSGGRGWRSHGVTAWVLAVIPLTILATALSWLPYLGWLVDILALYCALGMRSR